MTNEQAKREQANEPEQSVPDDLAGASPSATDEPMQEANPADLDNSERVTAELVEGTNEDAENDDDTPEIEILEGAAEKLHQKVETLTAECESLKDQLLRARAEFDNYRKRVARDQEALRAQAAKGVLGDLLSVLDNLDMAVAHGDDGAGGLREGVEMTAKQMKDVLAKHGCVPIETAGAAFDPELHEALMQSTSDEVPEGHIVQEFQRGYRLGETVLRHSRVIVSTGPEAPGTTPEADSTAAE